MKYISIVLSILGSSVFASIQASEGSRRQLNPREFIPLIEATPNSVGVLFKTSQHDYVHAWLPLGERLNSSERSVIPKDPVHAQITSMIMAEPKNAAPEALAMIECTLYPHFNRTSPFFATQESRAEQHPRAISFRKEDGSVRLDVRSSPFWFSGGALDSIECR